MTSVWRHYDVVNDHWRRQYNEISNYCCHCRFIQQFLWRSVCGCIFQGNATTNWMKWQIQLCVSGQIISISNSGRIIKIGEYLRKLNSNEKGSSFFLTHSVHSTELTLSTASACLLMITRKFRWLFLQFRNCM